MKTTAIEPLESRIAPATFVVNVLTDVTAPDDELTLREAITAANGTPAADTIKFDAALAGTITLTTGEIDITETLTILGGGKITISGNGASRIFFVDHPDTVKDHPLTVSGLKFIDGSTSDGGGAIRSEEGLAILSCTFDGNAGGLSGGAAGGAVRVVSITGGVTIKDSHFADNSADRGGAFHVFTPKKVTITGSVFAGNTATSNGGGGSIILTSTTAALAITTSIFSDNATTSAPQAGVGTGGGLWVSGEVDGTKSSKAAITSSSFVDNSAAATGGGLYVEDGAFALSGLTISGNTAAAGGGGLSVGNDAKLLSVSKSVITANSATAGGGGGMYLGPGATGLLATISSTQIVGNSASGRGGGIHADQMGGKLTVGGSLITGNESSSQGGGIAVRQDNPANLLVTLTGNTISGNEAASGGGGLALNRHGDFVLSKNIIAGNHAGGGGGGVEFDVAGKVALKTNQVVGNRADNGTGGVELVVDNDSSFTLSGDLIARNEGSRTGGLSILSSSDGTVAKNTKITGNIGGGAMAGGGVTVGASSGDVHLLAPVLGNFNRTTPANHQTFGTFATTPAAPPSPAGNITVTNLDDAGPGSLRQAIIDANGTPAADKIRFDPTLAGTVTLTSGELEVTETLTILGGGKIVLAGGGATRLFDVASADNTKDHPLTLHGLVLTGGAATGLTEQGGAIRSTEGIVLINCLLANNSSGSAGGGIFVQTATGAVTIKDTHFSDNSATFGGGGAVITAEKAITISGSTFHTNTGATGGGALVQQNAATGKIAITGSLFAKNAAQAGDGGGLALAGATDGGKFTTIAVTDTRFAGNTATGTGGGLQVGTAGVVLTGVHLSRNTAGTDGGGLIAAQLQKLAVSKSVVAGNTSASGGGVQVGPGAAGFTATFTATHFLGNTATDSDGGGLYASDLAGKLTVSGSLFAANASPNTNGGAGGNGGAIATRATGAAAVEVVLSGNTFTGNRALTGAGLSLTGDGPLTLMKNAVVANHATLGGGGGELSSIGKIKLAMNSILGNRADSGVGGLALFGPATASFTTAGDIIAFNEGTSTGGLHLSSMIAGIIAKNTKITANIGAGVISGGGVTQDSTNAVQLLATVLGNLNRTTPANNETFGVFAP